MTPQDAKLKYVMEEIKDILLQHDIAGVVVLHTPGQSEFHVHLEPSYSCAYFDGNMLKVVAKLEDFDGDTEAMQSTLSSTFNMFHTITMVLAMITSNLIDVEMQFKSKYNITYNKS